MNDKKLTIVYVIQTFHPHVGGTEQQLLTLLPLLQREGLKTAVVTRRLPGTKAKEVINGTMVYRCPVLPGRHLGSISFTLFALVNLFKLKPDCVHAFQLLSPLTIAVLYRKMRGTPIVCKVQRGGILGDLARVKAKRLSKTRINILNTAVDCYQVISQEIYHELESIGVPESKLKFIPNGVVLDHYAPVDNIAKKREIRAQLNLPQSSLIFVALGRLVAVKKIELLINSWKELTSSDSSSPALSDNDLPLLLIVGDGPEKKSLTNAADGINQIRFLGKRDDVKKILQAADLLIHASDSEGQSNAIQEGLASGLPVITSRVGAAEDQVQNGYNGWLFQPNNQQQLVTAIRAAIDQADDLHSLGSNSRKLIEEKYDIKHTARNLAKAYRGVIDDLPHR